MQLFERQMQNQQAIDIGADSDDKQKEEEKTSRAASKAQKKDQVSGAGVKRNNSASKMVESEADRSKQTDKQSCSIERIALFGEGSETIPFQPVEISKAEQNCLEGFCLLHGHGVEPNVEDAARWFNKAALMGESRAYFALGEMQENGIGCRINKLEATELYKKAAKAGDPNA